MNQLLRILLGLPDQASSWAASVDRLHATIIGSTILGSSLAALIALALTWRWRVRGLAPAAVLAPAVPGLTPRVLPPLWMEGAFISGMLGLFILWWWIGYRQFIVIQGAPPAGSGVEVYVSAKQWMWEFAYPDGRSSIGVLVAPRGIPVRLIMVSRDVIHGFFVPQLRLKHDVVPGRTSLAWFQADHAGIFDLWCSQYCGLDHSRMRGRIVVLDAPDYAAWNAGEVPGLAAEGLALERRDQPLAVLPQGRALLDLPQQGLVVAARHGCLACHTTDGQRHIGPSWRRLAGSTVVLDSGARVLADDAYLTESMMDPGAKIVGGYTNIMPTYQGQLEPGETAALLALIHALAADAPPNAVPTAIPPLPAVQPVAPPATPSPALPRPRP